MSMQLQLELLAARKNMKFAQVAKRIGMDPKKFDYRRRRPEKFELGDLIKMAAVFKMSIYTLIKELRKTADVSETVAAMEGMSSLQQAQKDAAEARKLFEDLQKQEDAFQQEYKEALRQLGQDMKSGEYGKKGYVSPLITVKKKYNKP